MPSLKLTFLTDAEFALAFADAENLGAAFRANALGCRPLVLQRNFLRVLDLDFLPALHAICGHICTALLHEGYTISARMSRGNGQTAWFPNRIQKVADGKSGSLNHFPD